MKWTTAAIADLTGRTAVITGANSGIGYETARALARAGATVVLACRSPERGGAAAERLRAEGLPGPVATATCDLADLASVAAFADEVGRRWPRLDWCINNAGVMVPPLGRTADGFETQFGINHLGHFALTGRLLPALLAVPGARVVVVSSLAHRHGRLAWDNLNAERRYRPWTAYFQSKLANLLFALELQRRARAAGTPLVVTAAHPGFAATELQRHSRLSRLFRPLVFQSAAFGALPTLRAAVDSDATGGEYFGPRGCYEMQGYPVRAHIARRARDADAAARLWTISEQLTGVRYAFGAAPGGPAAGAPI